MNLFLLSVKKHFDLTTIIELHWQYKEASIITGNFTKALKKPSKLRKAQ